MEPDSKEPRRAPRKTRLADQIDAKASRKMRARRHPVSRSLWSGLGVMGLIGWSVVIPTLLGTALGIWLNHHHPGKTNWTLALLMAGLTLGCLNAWHWVSKEDEAMRREREEHDD
jgi:ATP synthase protein I